MKTKKQLFCSYPIIYSILLGFFIQTGNAHVSVRYFSENFNFPTGSLHLFTLEHGTVGELYFAHFWGHFDAELGHPIQCSDYSPSVAFYYPSSIDHRIWIHGNTRSSAITGFVPFAFKDSISRQESDSLLAKAVHSEVRFFRSIGSFQSLPDTSVSFFRSMLNNAADSVRKIDSGSVWVNLDSGIVEIKNSSFIERNCLDSAFAVNPPLAIQHARSPMRLAPGLVSLEWVSLDGRILRKQNAIIGPNGRLPQIQTELPSLLIVRRNGKVEHVGRVQGD